MNVVSGHINPKEVDMRDIDLTIPTGAIFSDDRKYRYTLEYPEMLPKPIPYRGALGFFEVELPE